MSASSNAVSRTPAYAAQLSKYDRSISDRKRCYLNIVRSHNDFRENLGFEWFNDMCDLSAISCHSNRPVGFVSAGSRVPSTGSTLWMGLYSRYILFQLQLQTGSRRV